MPDSVDYSVRGPVAVLTIHNPPVNGLALRVRQGIAESLRAALSDDAVKAVIIRGAGKGFCGGADIREFGSDTGRAEPHLRTLCTLLEAAHKPVIAAMHGDAVGGGLELALACHHRVAAKGARLGLPEVKLGLLPGAGGTQRLPRLIGVEAALAMIVSGDSADAQRALQLGLVDEIADDELLSFAIEFATGKCKSLAEQSAALPVVSSRPLRPEDGVESLRAARQKLAVSRHASSAARACIECIEAATRLPMEEGLRFEREKFDELLASNESKAMRHLFFAQRAASKVPGIPTDTAVARIETVGVVGAGTMGGGIAMCFANAGIPVTVLDTSRDALERGIDRIRSNYANSVSRNSLSAQAMAERMALISTSVDDSDLREVDLVVEAVFEDMDVKKDVFRRLASVCKPGAILATNTSRLDVDEIAAVTGRAGDVIGLHFFSPANVMRLLEVVRGKESSSRVIAASMQLARRIGKLAVLVGCCDGFVGNRMLAHYSREADFLLEEGASVQQIDQALQGFGMAMGRFAMADMAGLDIAWSIRKRLAAHRPAHLRYSRVADRICEMGRFGQKTGAGYYRYEAGGRQPMADAGIEALVEQCARDAGIARRVVRDEEIVERTMYALINEGARILEEGIVSRASDIDLVYVNGYGFPAWRGGPMFLADSLGLDKVHARICEFHAQHGEHWAPAPLLKTLVVQGRTFAQA
ncbi:3-hydroxyacyl-CoA dehydrogenase [Diaphorobacter sp. HDW4A]|uniref:3-hydroxyacyl-CoA dehydrogenase NAD-binding domain-containing protein n=1 Tax=Diaphorobacter sp. HDW4A TaxID=2714924 RepID=UPI00140C8507|nr:3-hydroxyacyl-CoA dehydrogenase NAD-binding domain-containing protein [Diaphorobacter sp. HDW4A]QIL80005.1 3-hydroxyacyl-CoA dehydrogenase [Diaphorobacter sp. HDW4A]